MRAITPAPAACQPRPQPFPAAMEANLNGSQRPAERLGRLGLGLPLQVAEDDRLPIFFGKPIDLLVKLGVVHDFRPGFRGVAFVRDFGLFAFGRSAPGRLALARRATRRATPCNQGPSDSGFRMDRAFRARTRKTAWAASCAVVRTAKHVETDAVNDRAIPLDQSRRKPPRLSHPSRRGTAARAARRFRRWSSHDSRERATTPGAVGAACAIRGHPFAVGRSSR